MNYLMVMGYFSAPDMQEAVARFNVEAE